MPLGRLFLNVSILTTDGIAYLMASESDLFPVRDWSLLGSEEIELFAIGVHVGTGVQVGEGVHVGSASALEHPANPSISIKPPRTRKVLLLIAPTPAFGWLIIAFGLTGKLPILTQ